MGCAVILWVVTGVLDHWYGCREDREGVVGTGKGGKGERRIRYYGDIGTVTRKGVKGQRGKGKGGGKKR